jgi:hypothetical protein
MAMLNNQMVMFFLIFWILDTKNGRDTFYSTSDHPAESWGDKFYSSGEILAHIDSETSFLD